MKKLLYCLAFIGSSLFASSVSNVSYADVTYSQAVYEYITIRKPIQECYEEEYQQRVKIVNTNDYDDNSLGLDTIIGATAGVVIGNQIGKGNGKVAAKIVGGLLGAGVANKMRGNSYDDNYDYITKTRTKCVTKYQEDRKKRVLKGYKNFFYYDGVKYSKFTKHKKNKIRINTTITF